METARPLAILSLLLLFCASCHLWPGANSSSAYRAPKNIQLRKEAGEYLVWTSKLDYQKAFDLYDEAARNGDVLAMLASSMVKRIYLQDDSYIKSGSFRPKVIPAIKELADGGNGEAQYLLGWYYLSDNQHGALGRRYLKMAVDNSVTEAYVMSGRAYEDGRGGDKDPAMAAFYYDKGMTAGNLNATYYLAHLMADLENPNRNFAKAIELYNKSGAQGCIYSYYELGLLLADPKFPGHDYAKAVEYYRKAAGQGSADALYALGYSYETGLGAPVDIGKALDYYRKGAAKDDALSYEALGRMYYEGIGVTKDVAMARKMLQEAIARGNSDATKVLKEIDAYERTRK